jgi:hypothetical protein
VSGNTYLWEESILVSENSCSYYDFRIDENEKVTGEISSDDYFNVYFVTPRNFTKHEKGEDDFRYEYGTEHASKMKVNFIPKKAGRFYCIVESASQTKIDVNVSLHVRKSSGQRGFSMLASLKYGLTYSYFT